MPTPKAAKTEKAPVCVSERERENDEIFKSSEKEIRQNIKKIIFYLRITFS